MEIKMGKHDEFAFFRERAARLYTEGLSKEAKSLLEILDDEQAIRFAECNTAQVHVTKKQRSL